MPPQKGRVTVTGNIHKIRWSSDVCSGFWDTRAGRQTDRQTCSIHYSAPLLGQSNNALLQRYRGWLGEGKNDEAGHGVGRRSIVHRASCTSFQMGRRSRSECMVTIYEDHSLLASPTNDQPDTARKRIIHPTILASRTTQITGGRRRRAL